VARRVYGWMRLSIRGQRWLQRDVDRSELPTDDNGEHWLGECDYTKHRINVAVDLEMKPRLETLIHEIIHAAYPDMEESAVEDGGRAITNALWKEGWRLPHEHATQ
jgi:hypothetical protein